MQRDLCRSAAQVFVHLGLLSILLGKVGRAGCCTNLQMDPPPAQEDLRQRIGAHSKGPRVELITIKTLDQVVKNEAGSATVPIVRFCRSQTLRFHICSQKV